VAIWSRYAVAFFAPVIKADEGGHACTATRLGTLPGWETLLFGWRLVDQAQHWNSRGHFFAAAAEAMRRILVENARRKARRKHSGGWLRQEMPSDLVGDEQPNDDLLATDAVLTKLAERDPSRRPWSSLATSPG
jgi:hypothetical protein